MFRVPSKTKIRQIVDLVIRQELEVHHCDTRIPVVVVVVVVLVFAAPPAAEAVIEHSGRHCYRYTLASSPARG